MSSPSAPRAANGGGTTTVLVCSSCGRRLTGGGCPRCRPARVRRRVAVGLVSVLVAAGVTVAVARSGGPAPVPVAPDPAAPTGVPTFDGDQAADAFSNDTRLWIGAGQVGGAPTLAGDNVVQSRSGNRR